MDSLTPILLKLTVDKYLPPYLRIRLAATLIRIVATTTPLPRPRPVRRTPGPAYKSRPRSPRRPVRADADPPTSAPEDISNALVAAAFVPGSRVRPVENVRSVARPASITSTISLTPSIVGDYARASLAVSSVAATASASQAVADMALHAASRRGARPTARSVLQSLAGSKTAALEAAVRELTERNAELISADRARCRALGASGGRVVALEAEVDAMRKSLADREAAISNLQEVTRKPSQALVLAVDALVEFSRRTSDWSRFSDLFYLNNEVWAAAKSQGLITGSLLTSVQAVQRAKAGPSPTPDQVVAAVKQATQQHFQFSASSAIAEVAAERTNPEEVVPISYGPGGRLETYELRTPMPDFGPSRRRVVCLHARGSCNYCS
jgi:hypothetical protein